MTKRLKALTQEAPNRGQKWYGTVPVGTGTYQLRAGGFSIPFGSVVDPKLFLEMRRYRGSEQQSTKEGYTVPWYRYLGNAVESTDRYRYSCVGIRR